MERQLERAVLVIALVGLVYGAAGGPGWTAASGDALLATHLDRAASAPLYGLVAGIAARVPAGEPGFRLAVLNAALGALVLVGLLRAARGLLPRDPVAGVVAALLLALAPPFRDAAGFAGPAMLAACGAVWVFALAAAHARSPSPRTAIAALACAGIVIGSAPWLGVALAVGLVIWLRRTADTRLIAVALGAIGVAVVAWWLDAFGGLPEARPDLHAVVAATGRGAAAVVVGAGLLGAAFAAITGLPAARWLAAAIAIAAGHAIVFDHDPTVLLVLLAVGCAVLPGAVVRVVGAPRRHLIGLGAGLPLIAAAALTGPAIGIDDPGAAPARLATDVVGELPPGPVVFVAGDLTVWAAIEYAQVVAGTRPDVELVPPLPPMPEERRLGTLRNILVAALRSDRRAGTDGAGFVFLDPQWVMPRGRGFELLGLAPEALPSVPAPARYASAIGDDQAVELALARARFEAGRGRLDGAARAAGLVERFRAADLAVLAATTPTRARPAFFGFVPNLGGPRRDQLELVGDDLAWIAGLDMERAPEEQQARSARIDQPEVAAAPERRLHALWRRLWLGAITVDDPAIAGLGPAAVEATRTMLAVLKK